MNENAGQFNMNSINAYESSVEEIKYEENSTAEVASQDDAQAPNGAATTLIGRVAAPLQLEATPDKFHFWIARGLLVERNQFVRTESVIDDQKIEFFGLIEEVSRTSRKRDILEEYDEADGDALYTPPFNNEGVTYARVNILRSKPEYSTPPTKYRTKIDL